MIHVQRIAADVEAVWCITEAFLGTQSCNRLLRLLQCGVNADHLDIFRLDIEIMDVLDNEHGLS